MQHLEGSGTPVLYIGRKVLKEALRPEVLQVKSYRNTEGAAVLVFQFIGRN